jgi:CheY-like chemotaxis protein
MKKVIIADDIRAILQKEEDRFGRKDVMLFTVSSNEQALDLHRAVKADLIIVNLDSPEMGGEKLCSIIRDDIELCNVSIILIGSQKESNARRSVQCRANAFITGPPDKAVLLQEIDKLLVIAPRKILRVPLSIQVHVLPKGNPFIAYTENISVSGMLLYSEALLSEGDTVTCSFYLPDSTHITINAKVIRMLEKETEHDTNYYGVKFIDPDTAFRSAITEFVGKASRHNR